MIFRGTLLGYDRLPRWLTGEKILPALQEMQEMQFQSLGQEDH